MGLSLIFLSLLDQPGGLRNSRTTFILAHVIYAYRACYWPAHRSSTVLDRNLHYRPRWQ